MDKLPDSEIVKALECCSGFYHKCTECPFKVAGGCATIDKGGIYLDLINRTKANENHYRRKVQNQKQELIPFWGISIYLSPFLKHFGVFAVNYYC